jgi:large subunit ribosomal protein L6
MSRVGKNEVQIPAGVTLAVSGQTLSLKGPLGATNYAVPEVIAIEKTEKGIVFTPINQNKTTRMLWGTTNRNVSNIIKGVSQGFTLSMDLVGVGYRVAVAGQKITLQLGFSHDVIYDLPQGVTAKSEKPTSLVLAGPSKQLLGQIAAEIRSYRKPEPYKGKGVIREKEFVLRKEGKKK